MRWAISILKYLEENDDDASSNRFTTEEGFPVRGENLPFLKPDELEDLTLGFDAHVRTFATDKPEDMKAYQDILDRIANQAYVRLAPDKEEFIASREAWLILCRWAEIKGELPARTRRRAEGG